MSTNQFTARRPFHAPETTSDYRRGYTDGLTAQDRTHAAALGLACAARPLHLTTPTKVFWLRHVAILDGTRIVRHVFAVTGHSATLRAERIRAELNTHRTP